MFDHQEHRPSECMRYQVLSPFDGYASSRSLRMKWTLYLPTSCALSNITLD